MSSDSFIQWTKLLGTWLSDEGTALTTGNDGSIYIAGHTRGDLGGQTNSGNDDAFISKYNPEGDKIWSKLLGTYSQEYGYALTTGLDGSIYITGHTGGNLDDETNNGERDAFISKFKTDGTKVWTSLLGSPSSGSAYALTTGLDGSIYITGNTFGDFGGQINSGGGYQGLGFDAFISKYNSEGDKIWSKLLGTSALDEGIALTTGLDGSIYITGHSGGNLDDETNNGNLDAFISKYNSNGDKIWTRLVGTSNQDWGSALTTGNDGSIYIAGYTFGDLDDETNNGSLDTFISKFKTDGTKVWTSLLGSPSSDFGTALTTGLDGSIYITGNTFGDLDGQTNSGSLDAFITKYNPDGDKIWTSLLGSPNVDYGSALTTGNDGSIYITGHTGGNLDGETNSGYYDAFISKYNSIPTDISLSSGSFNENIDAESTVATLSTTDEIYSTSYTYELVRGIGDNDNDSFYIEGSELKIDESPDYETKSTYSILLKTTDSGGLSYVEAVTLNVNDLNEVATDISLSGSSFIEGWTKLLGTTNGDTGKALTTGSDGSIYIAGHTNGNLDGETNSGGRDAFISKFNTDGTKVWTSLLGSSSSDSAYALTTGTDESIYIAGYTFGDLDDETNNGNLDAFLSKYNPEGTKIWTSLLGSSNYELGYALTTGLDGSIYIAGYTSGNLNGETNSGSYDAFISKYNSDGEEQWCKLLGSPSWDSTYALTTGLDGSIYISGVISGDLDGQTNNGSVDTFISKYNSDGDEQWSKLLGTSYDDYGYALTTGLDGSIYIAGETYGDLDRQPNNGERDAFISKFNTDGTKVWTSLLGTSYREDVTALTTGLDGSIYIAGYTEGDLDGQPNSGERDAFISKFNTDGTKVWTSLLGSPSSDSTYALTTGLDGSIYIAGETYGDLDGQLNSGERDAFISKMSILFLPSEISLSSTSFNENIYLASTIATLSTTDEDDSDSHTYELVSGAGDADNSSFTIEENQLKINSPPDYETKSSYNIRLKTTDSGGLSYEESFTFDVSNFIEKIHSSRNRSLPNYIKNLTLTGSGNINGTGNASANTIVGNSGANRLNGGAGRDILIGNAGNDVLIGGPGIDDLRGGIGNDIYIVDNSSDVIREGSNQGTDLVYSSTHYYIRNNNVENLTLTGSSNINGTGNSSANIIKGNSGANRLNGGAGRDILVGNAGNDVLISGSGIDDLRGGIGNDIYIVDNSSDVIREGSNQGTDLVYSSTHYYIRNNNVENLTLTGSSNINGTGNSSANTIRGNSGANRLNGGVGRDLLVGNAGNDVLIGGPGIDDLRGGIGNDIYIVDNSGDIIGEGSNQGTDLVYSSTHYYIRNNNVENLTLTGSSNINGKGNSSDNLIRGNSGTNRLNGGAGRDILVGNAGNDVLIGGPGIDDLRGGIGNDIYIVDNSGDIIGEGSNQGTDLVYSSTHYYIRNNNVENLTLTGSSNINGTGNSSANIITGNSGANRLNGGAGRDILVGNAGNDVLIGGSGIDDLRGGIGNDIYIVDNSGDIIGEGSNQGTDLVYSSTHYYIRNNNVENLTLTGSSNINGTGNSSDNTITGNSGANRLNGGAGRDILVGNAGDDILFGGSGNDRLIGGDDGDVLAGNDGDDILFGGSGSDRLLGGDGSDILVGGIDNDTLTGGSGNDIFQINPGSGRDVITDYTSGEDRINLLGGLTINDLTFSNLRGNTRISDDDNLLAIVQNTAVNDITFI